MFLIGISEDPKAKGAGLQLKKVGLQGKGAGLQPKGAELPTSFPLLLQRLAEAFEQRLPCERLIMGWRPLALGPNPNLFPLPTPKFPFFTPNLLPPPPQRCCLRPAPASACRGRCRRCITANHRPAPASVTLSLVSTPRLDPPPRRGEH